MPPFDPDKYLAEKSAFNPDTYLGEKSKMVSEGQFGPPTYGYYGTDDKDLSLLQRAEKAVSESGGNSMALVGSGHEMFSPDSLEAKKKAAPYIAGGLLAAAAAPVALPAIATGIGTAAPYVGKVAAHSALGAGGAAGYHGGKAILKHLGLLK